MNAAYRYFAYFGLATLFGSLAAGFKYNPTASWFNVPVNIALYGAFAVPHLLLTRGWVKQKLWSDSHGSPRERRYYIAITVVTWIVIYALHRPVPGPVLPGPVWLLTWVSYVGMLGLVLSIVAFFEGTTFTMIDGLLGVPGSEMTHTHGSETPLLTTAAYARVRHPMYRAVFFGGVSSILIHQNFAAMLWAVMVIATFVYFIPIEERQLIAARGDDYRGYQKQTPWRMFPGIW